MCTAVKHSLSYAPAPKALGHVQVFVCALFWFALPSLAHRRFGGFCKPSLFAASIQGSCCASATHLRSAWYQKTYARTPFTGLPCLLLQQEGSQTATGVLCVALSVPCVAQKAEWLQRAFKEP